MFTPNGDNVNDLYFLKTTSLSDIDITIYDRWGNRVHGSTENPFNWDGFFNDELVLPGAYVFVIQIEYFLGSISRQKTLYGDVTVVR